ncbi:unnamed protein product [Meloidogyne enterolobii]|uniref:Uncharacterized protein n=1 Tax=Meloidogyne enterolobii TaxID=390850 RepID=A0ACB0ZZP5_MELEN
MDKQHSSYCPPSTTFGSLIANGSSEFSEANTYHQRHLEQQPLSGSFANYNPQNSMGLMAETSSNPISQQNGHFQEGCVRGANTSLPPPQPYQNPSTIKPNLPPSYSSATTGFPSLPPQNAKPYNPFGYKDTTNAFDMSPLLYETGIDNNPRHTGPAMNGAMNEDFLGDFVPTELQQAVSDRYVLSNELKERIDGSSKKQALFEIIIGLEEVAFGLPTYFNTWATEIRDRMVGRDPLPEPDLRIASEILIEMAVVLDESQYNYSCLCQFLDKNIENFSQNILLSQLALFINDTQSSLSLQHCCNLVTFLAELYDKIEVNGVKSSQLAAHLFDQLHGLLKLPSDNQGIGVIVKILKLTGRFLENDRGSEAMNAFMIDLNECAASCNDLTKLKVRNLLELRAKHWGIVSETARAGDVSNDSYPAVGLLGPDGEHLIPDDDCAFLDENFDTFGNSPSGSLYNNPIEEDNVEDEYDKFLQATAERTAERALVSFDEDDESIVSSPAFMSKQGNEKMS